MSKTVYKGERDRTSGRSIPVHNFVESPPPGVFPHHFSAFKGDHYRRKLIRLDLFGSFS